jgi:tetratricopeptide (TPR) repeat protein
MRPPASERVRASGNRGVAMSRFRSGPRKRDRSGGRDAARAPSSPSPPALLELIKQQTWKRFGWSGMIVLFVVGGAVATWANWPSWQKLPGVPSAVQWIKERLAPIRPSGRKFAVAIAYLEGDPDQQEFRRLSSALYDLAPGIEVLTLDRMISLRSGNQDDAMEAGHEEARRLLLQRGTDALLWGEVLPFGNRKQLRLHWTISPPHWEARAVKSTERYPLSEDLTNFPLHLDLPALFWEDLSSVLGAVVAAKADDLAFRTSFRRFMASKEGYEHATNYDADDLREFLQRTEVLLRSDRVAWTSAARAEVALAYAYASGVYGELTGDNAVLAKAVDAYRDVLMEHTREKVPLKWAETQNMLAGALMTLGLQESETARLKDSAVAYREALKEFTREKNPLEWAGTQVMLGVTLLVWAERDHETARLEEAVGAFSEGLKELKREKVPLKWAAAQRGLGLALTMLGEQESGTARLEEAAKAYREALKEFTREKNPLEWADTQNELGIVLGVFGERQSGTTRLDEAVVAFREAKQVLTREKTPLKWATAQYGLGRVLQALGEREEGTARLEGAVAAFQEALPVLTRERGSLTPPTQEMLGLALATLGERQNSAARLEDAVTAYREALRGYSHDETPLDWARTQRNLGDTLRALGEREEGTARLEEAAAAYREALKKYSREEAPLAWGETLNDLGAVLGMLGRRESGTARLQNALKTTQEALKALTRENAPLQWAEAQNTLGNVLTAIGEREGSTKLIESAIKSLRVALTVVQDQGATDRVDRFRRDLDGAHRVLEKLSVAGKTRR